MVVHALTAETPETVALKAFALKMLNMHNWDF